MPKLASLLAPVLVLQVCAQVGVPGRAAAHPGGAVLGQLVAVRVLVEGEGARVDLDYVAELPTLRLLAEARALVPGVPAAVEAARLAEVAEGLWLSWRGARIPLEAGATGVRDGDPGFRELHVAKLARLPGLEGELRITNRNFPDEAGFLSTAFHLDGGLVATGSNLASVRDGRLRDNRNGAWVRDEATRESWVALRPAAWWERGDAPAPLTGRFEGLDVLAFPTRAVGGAAGGLLLAVGGWVWWRGRALPAGGRA